MQLYFADDALILTPPIFGNIHIETRWPFSAKYPNPLKVQSTSGMLVLSLVIFNNVFISIII